MIEKMNSEGYRGKTLLLVEDEAIIAMEESSILRRRGFKVVSVSSGEGAVRLIADGEGIDLVLMDIDLGHGMDGTEAARKILEIRKIPIVFLSSHTDPDIVDRTEKIASYGYVVKQAGETVLIASVRMAFRLHDVQERFRRQNEVLSAMNCEMRLMLKNMITAFVVWDPVFDENGKFVSFRFDYFNEAYERIVEFPIEKVRGKDVFDVWPETEQSWLEVYGDVATTGNPRTFKMFHKPTNGWYFCNAYRSDEVRKKVCVVFLKVAEDRETRPSGGPDLLLLS